MTPKLVRPSLLAGAGVTSIHLDADDVVHEDTVWKSSYVNSLPDNAFLYIEPGGTKDEAGHTDSAHRHFPYKDDTGAVDLVHVRNAIGRIPQSNVPDKVKAKLQAKAQALLTSAQPASHNDSIHLDASKMKRTPQGGLRGPATPSKVGVFKYRHHDGPMAGKIVREYRPAEEVFHPDSLATLDQATLTDFHPADPTTEGFITPENYAKFSKGQLTTIAHNDTHVTAEVIIQDAKVVADVLAGRRVELSPGYTSRFDWTAGVFQGQPYDCIQRNIRYNHVAILPRGAARQGSDVALRFDAAIVTETPMIIHLDGKDYDLATEDGRKAYNDAMIAKVTAEKTRADAAEGARDAAVAELAPLKTAQAQAARTALETVARKILKDPQAKFDGLTDRQVREKAIGVDCTGKDDGYVVGRFDALDVPVTEPDPALEAGRQAMLPAGHQDPVVAPAAPAYANRWKEPLTASKDRK